MGLVTKEERAERGFRVMLYYRQKMGYEATTEEVFEELMQDLRHTAEEYAIDLDDIVAATKGEDDE